MTDKHYMKKRFKCRCYEKDHTVKIYDNSETILDISYRDFDDAFYCSRKLKPVIDKLNTLVEENEQLKNRLDNVLKELYCKDRKLEELNVDIECCDKND